MHHGKTFLNPVFASFLLWLLVFYKLKIELMRTPSKIFLLTLTQADTVNIFAFYVDGVNLSYWRPNHSNLNKSIINSFRIFE